MNPRFIKSIDEISPDRWNHLVPQRYPFASYEYLAALENSGCVGDNTGWTPLHLIVEEAGELVLAMPLYEKSHSYGEYVFDWQWASAFEHYGRAYFPKLLTAIPFTPATGPRILCRNASDRATLLPLVRSTLDMYAGEAGTSSWHLLFADSETEALLGQQQNLMKREDVQFHWKNTPQNDQPETGASKYRDFDHFLEGFRSSKRKQIKRERRKITEQGLDVQRRAGQDISPEDWKNFYACYRATYLKRSGHTGYLNEAFFDRIAETLAEQCMLVTAHQDQRLVASSLFFFDDCRLYGRYWGALADYDCLHFEACYYQGIEFAIERGLECFDPGTQGEHKLVRGFEPTKTHSFHWVADPEFSRAIDEFLQRERSHTDQYKQAASNCLPFRRE